MRAHTHTDTHAHTDRHTLRPALRSPRRSDPDTRDPRPTHTHLAQRTHTLSARPICILHNPLTPVARQSLHTEPQPLARCPLVSPSPAPRPAPGGSGFIPPAGRSGAEPGGPQP